MATLGITNRWQLRVRQQLINTGHSLSPDPLPIWHTTLADKDPIVFRLITTSTFDS